MFKRLLFLPLFILFFLLPSLAMSTTVNLIDINDDGSMDYTTFQAAESATQGNLTSLDEINYYRIFGAWAAEEQDINIDGSVTDSTHFIRIETFDTSRSTGVWNEDAYTIGQSSAQDLLDVADDNVQIIGVQFNAAFGSSIAVDVVPAQGQHIYITQCIFQDTNTTTNSFTGIRADVIGSYVIYNNLFSRVHWAINVGSNGSASDTANAGIYALYNTMIGDFQSNAKVFTATASAKNSRKHIWGNLTVGFTNFDSFGSSTTFMTGGYNRTNLPSFASAGTNWYAADDFGFFEGHLGDDKTVTYTFVDSANDSFMLAVSDVKTIGRGGTWPLVHIENLDPVFRVFGLDGKRIELPYIDIAGNPRPSDPDGMGWDIGCFQNVVTWDTVEVREDGAGDYTSLAAAETGEQADLNSLHVRKVIQITGFWNDGEVFTDNASTGVTFDGWTVDYHLPIHIEVIGRARVPGRWIDSSGYYAIIFRNVAEEPSGAVGLFNSTEPYIYLDGLVVIGDSMTQSSSKWVGITIADGGGVVPVSDDFDEATYRIRNCIVINNSWRESNLGRPANGIVITGTWVGKGYINNCFIGGNPNYLSGFELAIDLTATVLSGNETMHVMFNTITHYKRGAWLDGDDNSNGESIARGNLMWELSENGDDAFWVTSTADWFHRMSGYNMTTETGLGLRYRASDSLFIQFDVKSGTFIFEDTSVYDYRISPQDITAQNGMPSLNPDTLVKTAKNETSTSKTSDFTRLAQIWMNSLTVDVGGVTRGSNGAWDIGYSEVKSQPTKYFRKVKR